MLVGDSQLEAPFGNVGLGPVDKRCPNIDLGRRFRAGLDDRLEGLEKGGSTVRVASMILAMGTDHDRITVGGFRIRDGHGQEGGVPRGDVGRGDGVGLAVGILDGAVVGETRAASLPRIKNP